MTNIRDLSEVDTNAELWGGKATALSKLVKGGFPVPKGFVVSSQAYDEYFLQKKDDTLFMQELERKINDCFGKDDDIVFRSSASIENDGQFAACGVFESVFHKKGARYADDIRSVWASADTVYSRSYFDTVGIEKESVKMAVIVQKVEIKKYSAVIQSYDLVNEENHIVVEYIEDGVNSIVDGKKDANSFAIDMHGTTVYGDWTNDLSPEIMSTLITDVKRLEAVYGGHIEIEAQIDAKSVSYLQIRKLSNEV